MSTFKTEFDNIRNEYELGVFREKTNALVKLFREKKVVLYGAGTLSIFVMKHLEKYNVNVECFCDTYRSGVHKLTGLPIITVEQLKKDYADAIVIITSEQYGKSIMNTLMEVSYQGEIYSFDELLGFYTVTYEEFAPHIEGYEWAYEYSTDKISKQVILDAIRTRLLGTKMSPSMSAQYFENDVCPLSDKEVFVDGGCFTGDTSQEYIRQLKGKYAHIYGFEPDEYNYKKACANLQEYCKVDVYLGGLWHMTNSYKFVSGEFGNSRFTEEGDILSQTYSLDDFFKDKTDKPTFIKMDIEGSELLALDGAAQILRTNKPKLAICVYHNIKDMYVLPRRILYHNPEYKLVFRHYSGWYAETVCYGI